MASVSVSHLILFIASMIVAASVAGVLTNTVDQLGNAIDDQGLQISQDVRTDVEIITDAGADNVYESETITLHVKNTGSETLPEDADAVEVFVNGQFETDVGVTLEGDASSWRPGEVARLAIEEAGLSGDTRVQVTANGDEEVFEFRA